MSRGAFSLGVIKGRYCASRSGTHWNTVRICSLTVVSVSGPAEVLEPSIAQVEGGFIALPQGCAVPQGQGGMLRTPESDDAVLLTSGRRG